MGNRHLEHTRNFESDWAGWTEVKKPMATVSIGLPEEMVAQLKQMAPRLGFQNYQDLIQYYLHNGLMRDLKAMQKFEGLYEIARNMAEDGASAEEFSVFLENGRKEVMRDGR